MNAADGWKRLPLAVFVREVARGESCERAVLLANHVPKTQTGWG